MKHSVREGAQSDNAGKLDCSIDEWNARVELAGTYRLFYALGWHELIYNHITVRVPGTSDYFLINPFGLTYREVTASNLVKIDIDGNIIGRSEFPANPAGFVVHSAVHAARHDVSCVMHTHTTAGMVVACQRDGLLPISFPSMFYTDRIAYHDFEGITLENDERERMVAALGSKNVLILRNHGLLTCGVTVADAFAELYHLQRACEVQVALQSTGAANIVPSIDLGRRVAGQFDRCARQGDQNTLMFNAMLRWVDSMDLTYKD